ncbi:hypothetical protein PILCRDRAFT_95786 [Piloderma croceum F 1598]|uniref:Protein kinase domain-containing protein n=1 Tax=Piloderma croceum (strain F 1598) TaxID=765440 RepID=A0A0C3BM40_PILCF|nr:hypothetical protein PILCRDRAFT_95786 [Piloderma croceum F 1598]
MAILQEIIPEMSIPFLPELVPSPSRSTAGYAPTMIPPRQQVPYWILHSPSLADSMMQELHEYLATAPGAHMPPSAELQGRTSQLPTDLHNTPTGSLGCEKTTTELWDYCLFRNIRLSVQEVDQNATQPMTLANTTLYSQTPDTLICPEQGTPPRLHREDKSWVVFDAYAERILDLAQNNENGQLGTSLELTTYERHERSIIMKMGVSMIAGAGGQNPIPYGILFGDHKFILFSLFRNEDTLGEVRYGLACSSIIDTTSTATPLIPLIIYTLLGKTNRATLHKSTFSIPPIPISVKQDSRAVTRNRKNKFISLIKAAKVTLHISSTASESSTLVREPNSSVNSAATSFGPLTQSPPVYIATAVSSLYNLITTASSTLSQLLIKKEIVQPMTDPRSSNAAFVPLDQTDSEIWLTECIGYGAVGQIFLGTVDNDPNTYAVKIAPWEDGKKMLRQEADIYMVLSALQGRFVPKIFSFFGSDRLKVLVMQYMGPALENISDLTADQRRQLLDELSLIHEHGVVHGDLRSSNIVLQNGTDPHFIDFSHGYQHHCTGRATCSELIEARRFLLLDTAHLV